MKYVFLLVLFISSSADKVFADQNLIPIQTIMLESAGESLNGQIAVAEVIRNRVNRLKIASNKPQDEFLAEKICLSKKQFSCWNNSISAKKKLFQMSGNEFQKASRAWEASKTSNLTFGSINYYNPKLCSPKWANKMQKTVKIGNHQFLK